MKSQVLPPSKVSKMVCLVPSRNPCFSSTNAMSRRITPGSRGRSTMSQYLDTSSAFAGPAGIAAITGAERATSAPLARSRRPKPGAASSAEARASGAARLASPARADAFEGTRAPWMAALREEPARAATEAGATSEAEAALVSATIVLRERNGVAARGCARVEYCRGARKKTRSCSSWIEGDHPCAQSDCVPCARSDRAWVHVIELRPKRQKFDSSVAKKYSAWRNGLCSSLARWFFPLPAPHPGPRP